MNFKKKNFAHHHERDALSGYGAPNHHTDRIATEGRNKGREGRRRGEGIVTEGMRR